MGLARWLLLATVCVAAAALQDALPGQLRCSVGRMELGEPVQVICNGVVFSASILGSEEMGKEEHLPFGTAAWWIEGAYALCCVVGAALAAGLTLGLTSIDEFGLRVLCNRLPEEVSPRASPQVRLASQRRLVKDQVCAKRILPVIGGRYFSLVQVPQTLNPTNRHYLLVTLMLANAAANEALPVFLGRMVPEWLAVILSVSVVVIFGEIVPSAIFMGPNQLSIAAKLAPLVRLLKLLLLPVVWPISLVLDFCLGHGADDHCRAEVKALVRTLKSHCLELDEASLLHGVLELHSKKAPAVGQPLDEAHMVAHDAIVSAELVSKLLLWGHHRVLVYRRDPEEPLRRNDVMGFVRVADLLTLPLPEQGGLPTVEQALIRPVVLGANESLLTTLQKLQGSSRLAIISQQPETVEEALEFGRQLPAEARPFMFCDLADVLQEILKGGEDTCDSDVPRWLSSPRDRSGALSKIKAELLFGDVSRTLEANPGTSGDLCKVVLEVV